MAALGADHVAIGTVASNCILREGTRLIDGAYLSDVDCSASRITRALRERAAEVGGTAIVGRRCVSRVLGRSDAGERLRIRCEATVARPSSDALWRDHGTAPVEHTWATRASDAWNIRVSYTPGRGDEGRPPRTSEHVHEVAVLPASHLTLGDVVTKCRRGCGRDATREGVREVAGRVGANSVVGVGCSRKSDGWICTGTAAAHRVDPDTNPAAR